MGVEAPDPAGELRGAQEDAWLPSATSSSVLPGSSVGAGSLGATSGVASGVAFPLPFLDVGEMYRDVSKSLKGLSGLQSSMYRST